MFNERKAIISGITPSFRGHNFRKPQDHLQRIHEHCEEDEDRAKTAQATMDLLVEKNLLIDNIQEVMALIQAERWQAATTQAHKTSRHIHQKVEPYRAITVNQVAVGQIGCVSG